ncbi:MAG: hypothetical protein ACREBW_10405 [Candidatus Micrarchaeaceae archaeon]
MAITPFFAKLSHPKRQGFPVPNFITIPQWVDVLALVAATAQTYIIPAGASFLQINATGNVWVDVLGNVVVSPTATNTAGNAPILLTSSCSREFDVSALQAGQLSFIAAAAQNVSISAWS